MKFDKKKSLFNIIAILAGVQLPLAFAPFNVVALAFISPALLLALWADSSPRQAFERGFYYGLGCFSVGASWVYISIHTFGNANMLVAAIFTALFIIALALFIAVQGYVFARLFPKPTLNKYLFAFPLCWVLFEWIRTWAFSGFPWLLLGYSQLSTPLSALAPIFGVYGVSFAVALTSAVIIIPFTLKRRQTTLFTIFMLLIIWGAAGFLQPIKWTKPKGQPIKVSLIQGNIPQQLKWQPEQLESIMNRYQQLTSQHWDSKLIIWPEGAIPTTLAQVEPWINNLNKIAKQHNTTIITGVVRQDLNSKYYNTMIAIGENHSRYYKRHLVPFGEYAPFPLLTNFITNLFQIPMSDFSPGPWHQPPFHAANLIIAPSICYETAYPIEQLSFLPAANLLVNISDDSWFGRSIASPQQLQITQMRSLESGRWQLVSTNTGLTAIIGPKGRIKAIAPADKKCVLTANIQPMQGATPWIKFAHYLEIIHF